MNNKLTAIVGAKIETNEPKKLVYDFTILNRELITYWTIVIVLICISIFANNYSLLSSLIINLTLFIVILAGIFISAITTIEYIFRITRHYRNRGKEDAVEIQRTNRGIGRTTLSFKHIDKNTVHSNFDSVNTGSEPKIIEIEQSILPNILLIIGIILGILSVPLIGQYLITATVFASISIASLIYYAIKYRYFWQSQLFGWKIIYIQDKSKSFLFRKNRILIDKRDPKGFFKDEMTIRNK